MYPIQCDKNPAWLPKWITASKTLKIHKSYQYKKNWYKICICDFYMIIKQYHFLLKGEVNYSTSKIMAHN